MSLHMWGVSMRKAQCNAAAELWTLVAWWVSATGVTQHQPWSKTMNMTSLAHPKILS